MANQTPFSYTITIIITTLLLIISNASACNEDDKNALLTINNVFGGNLWNPATNCCSWYNIRCNNAGRVNLVYIFLYRMGNNLPPLPSVPFPSAFANLSALQYLTLQGVPFTGPIPPYFANFSQLEYLALIETRVSGPIPDFSANRKLKDLILMSNDLYGPIPRSLTMLPNLRNLNLNFNSLNGSIPRGLFHRSKAGSDLYLQVAWNQLSGNVPMFLGNGNLRFIDASRNSLTGAAEFLSAPRMGSLTVYLSANKLRFDFTNVSLSPNITMLDLSYNTIQGAIPESLNLVTNLWGLNLSNNKLCGKIPAGQVASNFKADSFGYNKCLCGAPLAPCA